VATLHAWDDGDGVINNFNKNSHLLTVNSSQKATFSILHIVAMLGNIVIALREEDDHHGYTFYWFWGTSQVILLGQLGKILFNYL